MALNDETEILFKSERTDVDPVSGNEVPPGSLPEEVRDDIPAMLSEGEYVVPADMLRYYGVKFFEDLRAQAKMGLAVMEANGRIGGEPIQEELPFSDEELMSQEVEQTQEFSEGGLPFRVPGYVAQPDLPQSQSPDFTGGVEYRVFTNAQGQTLTIPFFNGQPMGLVPEGYTEGEAVQKEDKTVSQDNDDNPMSKSDAISKASEFEKENREEIKIDYKNPDSVKTAVDTYYSSGPMFKLFGPLGFAADLGIKKYEKNNLLKSIDETLNDTDWVTANEDEAKEITKLKSQLLDKKEYEKEATEERGFGDWIKDLFGFGDGSFNLENDPIEQKPDGISNQDWSNTTLSNWVDATNVVQSLHPSDDPMAYHAAIRAQSDASRAATAAARAAAAEKENDTEGVNEPTP